MKVDSSIFEILEILYIRLLEKTPIELILMKCDNINLKELDNKRLIIIGFQVPTNVIKYLIYIFRVITLYNLKLTVNSFQIKSSKIKIELVE